MANGGLIYNLNFSDIHPDKTTSPEVNYGSRRHRLSIYKANHTPTITYDDNNIIGTDEPAVLIWDNTDDIYNNIMASRLEINLIDDGSSNVVDVDDILSASSNSTFEAELFVQQGMEYVNGSLQPKMVLYWKGYLSNAEYKENISSTPQKYQLVATDLLTTLKNITTVDGSAVVMPKATTVEYLANLLGFLPYGIGFKVNQPIEILDYRFGFTPTGDWEYLHKIQHAFTYTNGFDKISDNAYDYLVNTLKAFNARLFYADGKWYMIPNALYTHKATDDAITAGTLTSGYSNHEHLDIESTEESEVVFEEYTSSGSYDSSATVNILKIIPDQFKALKNDLELRYETPVDRVSVNVKVNKYTPTFRNMGELEIFANNLNNDPSFELKINGVLFNNTYYSDYINTSAPYTDYINQSRVLTGDFSIKTQSWITTGTPTFSTDKIYDSGFSGDMQYYVVDNSYLTINFYHKSDGVSDTSNITIYYALMREYDQGAGSFTQYWSGSAWVTYTSESSVVVHDETFTGIENNTWQTLSKTITAPSDTSGSVALKKQRYRIVILKPKIHNAQSNSVFFIDKVVLDRYAQQGQTDTDRNTVHSVIGSNRRRSTKSLEFNAPFYSAVFNFLGLQHRTPRMFDTSGTGLDYHSINNIHAQSILNDNRTHLKRYSITCKMLDGITDLIYPYHKIWINFSNYQTLVGGMIDRLKYSAKSGTYDIEFHLPNQADNVTMKVVKEGDFDLLP